MHDASPSRYVKVAAPTAHAGIGNALRQAFAIDGIRQPVGPFDDLIARLG